MSKAFSRKKLIDSKLAEMIARDLQPVSIMEDEGFLEYYRTLDQKYKPPCRQTPVKSGSSADTVPESSKGAARQLEGHKTCVPDN